MHLRLLPSHEFSTSAWQMKSKHTGNALKKKKSKKSAYLKFAVNVKYSTVTKVKDFFFFFKGWFSFAFQSVASAGHHPSTHYTADWVKVFTSNSYIKQSFSLPLHFLFFSLKELQVRCIFFPFHKFYGREFWLINTSHTIDDRNSKRNTPKRSRQPTANNVLQRITG